jgi:uncharacterized membrane protein
MSKNQRSVVINAPVELVFAFAADFENDPRWRGEVQRMQYTTGRPVGVGSRAAETARMLGQTPETTTVTTDYEPNRRVAAKSTSGPVPIVASRDFETVPGGTRFTYTLEGDTSGVLLFRLMGSILTRLYQKRIESYLRTLKGILETEPAATTG